MVFTYHLQCPCSSCSRVGLFKKGDVGECTPSDNFLPALSVKCFSKIGLFYLESQSCMHHLMGSGQLDKTKPALHRIATNSHYHDFDHGFEWTPGVLQCGLDYVYDPTSRIQQIQNQYVCSNV